MGISVTKHGFTYRSKVDAHIEELAADLRMRSRRPAPGIGFARKESNAVIRNGSAKSEARTKVATFFNRFSDGLDRPMKVLGLPGIFWKFERELSGLNRCEFYACESDAAIFRASIRYMPGYKHHDGIIFMDNATVISKFVYEYKYMPIERYLKLAEHRWDCTWLDYTGFITPQKLLAIKTAFERTDSAFAVTLLEARQAANETRQIKAHGSIEAWLSAELGTQHCDVHRYIDGVPMVQIMWDCPKETIAAPLEKAVEHV